MVKTIFTVALCVLIMAATVSGGNTDSKTKEVMFTMSGPLYFIFDTPQVEETIETLDAELEEVRSEKCDSDTEFLQTIEDDIYLIALMTVGEAEGEPETGQRLVICSALNRADSPHFPDTIHDVIYQPNQYSVMWDGRAERCMVTDEMLQLVREEIEMRSNTDVIFFDSGGYSKYGEPMFKVGNHYFSSYD